MTAVTDRPRAALPRPAAPSVVVLLHVPVVGPALVSTLDALQHGSQRPEHVLVLDASDGGDAQALCELHPLGQDGIVTTVRVPAGMPPRAAYDLTTGADPAVVLPEGTSMLWLLAAGHVPQPDALRHLADALRRSPSSGVAGPKLVTADDPSRLVAVGISATWSGRVMSTPSRSEPDMGQYDSRGDVLAVPAAGLLVERPLWDELRGFQTRFGDLGADLDLSWRAHLAGSRVLATPSAGLAVPSRSDEPATASTLAVTHADTASRRRAARRVALTRSAWWSAPLLAAWILLSTLGAALALLLAKRPAAAAAALGDSAALLDPWRPLAGRWDARGTRRVARRDLRSLFVPRGVVTRHVTDLVQASIGTSGPGADLAPYTRDALTEVDRADADPVVDIGSIGGRLVRNPGGWAVLAALVASVTAWRAVGAGPVQAFRVGLVGGELTGARVTPAALLHDWWDGWAGGGMGSDALGSPANALLAGPAWLASHVPFLAVTSPGGSAVALLVAGAMPLAACTAYVAGRVVTPARWPRALVALAWAGSAVASAAVAEGRLGALVALVLLPLLAAGVSRTLSTRGTTATATLTGMGGAVVGAFAPAVLVALLGVLVIGVVIAPGAAKARAILTAVLPVGLLGPWLGALVADPAHLLAGPGLLARGSTPPDPLRLGLLFPGGSSHPWWFTAPLLALALLCLLRAGRQAWVQTALGVLMVVALTATYAAPRVRIGSVPLGEPGAGRAVTPWWGLPMLVCLLAVLAMVLVGLSDLRLRRSRARWWVLVRWPAVAVLLVVAVGGAVLHGWHGVSGLRAWADPRPAIAVDQAVGDLANRTLLLTPTADGMTYRLVGREASPLAPDLPRGSAVAPTAGSSQPPTAVEQVLDGDSDGIPAAKDLLDLGVGFVGLGRTTPVAIAQRLDATAGLVRMGSRGGFDYWRVKPPVAAAADTSVGTPRARVDVRGGKVLVVPVTGLHSATRTTLRLPAAGTLTIAEPRAWATHAIVTANDRVLVPKPNVKADVAAYALPAGTVHLTIAVHPDQPWWRWAQLALLLVAFYLAIPAGRRRAR